MAIVNCPECGKKLKVADTSIGKKVKCSCGTVFVAEAADALPSTPNVAEKVLVACTECASKLKVAATSLGKKTRCPKCAGIFVAAIPATAMAEETMIPPRQPKPAPVEDEEEPLNVAAAEFKGDDADFEEDRPKPKAKPRKKPVDEDDEEDEEDKDEPQVTGKPVYPSRLFVNLFVVFLVLAYMAFFAVAYPMSDNSMPILDLGLVKPRATLPPPIPRGKQVPGVPSPGKGKGKKGQAKKDEFKADDAKKDNNKKDDPKVEKDGAAIDRMHDPALVFARLRYAIALEPERQQGGRRNPSLALGL